ncbi:hypothetical protein HGI47_15400 [Novosphingobium sp. ERN07]|uniref:hypothetical protein n=1 Tax=Novosphingobium sp. ERN07 TaxID=2726187 RepID=UPI001456F889|nr:hypothetical protein [Novosphingobium sp. ERN07]NLR72260.1 hypothetical protein [Novosphingobium sp. ERN07]
MIARHRSCLATLAAALTLTGCDSEPKAEPTPVAVAAPLPQPAPSPAPLPEPEPSASAATAMEEPPALAGIRYAPRDDCADKPGWPAFRKALVTAIKARDADAMAALATPDIALDYGGGSGTAELKKRLADPESGLWHELSTILPLGCAVEGGLAAMPWVFWNVPEAVDSYNAMLVLGNETPLREKPGGEDISPVGWFIVGIDPMDFDPKANTTRVTLDNGQKGWVETAKLRSLLDYRLIAEPKDGVWRITAFIAGD